MPKYEYIYEIVKDADGVDCFIKRGEVFRCRDCRGWNRENGYCAEFLVTDPNGYCSFGERKDDAETD